MLRVQSELDSIFNNSQKIYSPGIKRKYSKGRDLYRKEVTYLKSIPQKMMKIYHNTITNQSWVEYPPKKGGVLNQVKYKRYPYWIFSLFVERELITSFSLSGIRGIIREWELSRVAETFLKTYDRLRGKGYLWFRLYNCGKWYVQFLPGHETKEVAHDECLYKIPMCTLQLPPDIYSVRRSQVAALFSDAAFRGIVALWEPHQQQINACDKMYTSCRYASKG